MSSWDLAHWVASALFGALFVLLALANVRLMFIVPRRLPPGEHGPSPVPIAGGLFGIFACLMAPHETLRWLFWLPPLLDPGSALLGFLAWRATREAQSAAESLSAGERAARRASVGCLLGTAVGDALGLATEGLSKRRLARMYPDTTRYRLLFGRGLCSDDTEHACMTAQALLAARLGRQAIDVDDFAYSLAWRLRFWLLGLPAGVGLATGRAILKLWLGFPPHRAGVFSAGNGPAMRSPILGVVAGDDETLLRALLCASTRLTHSDPRAEQGALAVALAARRAASGNSLAAQDVAAELSAALGAEGAELALLIRDAAASVARGEDTAAFAAAIGCADGVSGYMLHTVPVALHAWLSFPEDLPAALQAAIRCGGDTDSVAAIVGALVGARVGPEGIPPLLLDGLVEWPRTVAWMTRLGEKLAWLQSPNAFVVPPGLNPPGLLLRNAAFLVVVLAHGLRRLLPPY